MRSIIKPIQSLTSAPTLSCAWLWPHWGGVLVGMAALCWGLSAHSAESLDLRFEYAFIAAPDEPAAMQALRTKLAPSAPVCQWTISSKDKSLRQVFEDWSLAAGWQPVWEMPVDFSVDLAATFCGGFEAAVESVLQTYSKSATPMRGLFYTGNRVLRIVSAGR